MSRRISVEITGDASNLQRSFRHASRSAAGFNRDLGRATRGGLVATGALGKLGRAAAFASGYFIGGAGLVYGIKSTIEKAEESQRVLGQTRVAVENAGLSWKKYGRQIRETALAQANVSGFDDERLLGTFSSLVRRTGDVNKALQYNALATDVARGSNMELEQAQKLVLKASLGMAGQLRRVGIDAKNGATGVELIDLLTRKFTGSAAAFGHTAVGAQERFQVSLENTQETIGTALLPTITQYLNKGSNWLSQSKHQAQIQRDVRRAVVVATQAIHGMTDTFRVIGSVVRPVNRLLGGTRHTAMLLTAAFVAFKLRGVASLVTGSATAVKALLRLTAAEEAASVAGGGLPGAAGKAGKVGKAGQAVRAGAKSLGALSLGIAAYNIAEGTDQYPGVHKKKTGGFAYRKGADEFTVFPGGRPGRGYKTPAGQGDVHIHGPINVHAKNVDEMLAQLQKKAKRNAAQRRGRHGGSVTGTG